MKKTIVTIALCVFVFHIGIVQAATIVLKSGKTVTGQILEETPEYIRIQQGETPIYYQRTYITEINRDDAAQAPAQGSPVVADTSAKEPVAGVTRDHLAVGLRLASEGQWDAAEETLRQGEVNNPYDPNILGALDLIRDIKEGRIESQCGQEIFQGTYALLREDYAEAVTHLERARSLVPGQADVSYNLGVAYYSMGEFEKALAALEEVLRIKPDDATTYVLVGNIYQLLGDKEKAQEHLYIAQTLFDKSGQDESAAED